ncbi:MAG: membrane dipeptidase [Rikenellaceae bacterium]|jgi:microsomal dipeptidase-like Zn-dependent dipeptidase/gamma-glutamyl-gamma-aminobutyrate hydrolase PuuD|nr:membrane dipeptidase [Rikenellaceae bacterium]
MKEMKDPHITPFATETDGTRPHSERAGQPVIGLSVNVDEGTSRLHEAYIRSVLEAGGIPLLIPATDDAEALREAVERVDGVILTGGGDVDGHYFGEETLPGIETDPLRDRYDFLLLRVAADRQLPVLGICRGAQVMNIAYGGTIYQDIPSQYPTPPLDHRVLHPREKPAHPVTLAPDSDLARIFGRSTVEVNSRHHQAIREVAEGFRVTATAPDGVIEAIEGLPHRPMWGVQWHPENLAAEGGDEAMKALFRFFIAEAALFKRAKDIHQRHLIVDSHCDTPMLFADHRIDIGRRDPVAQVDLTKMAEGMLDAEFVVAYLPQGERNETAHEQATAQAIALLQAMKEQVAANAEFAGQAVTFAEADRLKATGRRAIFLGVENGYAIGRDLNNLELFRRMGVVYITLCHNGANDLCDSASGAPEYGGLSALGREAVRQMNRLGLVIDLSHAAETTFYDTLTESQAPVICSHSSARALCDHPRNLTDDQIRALSARGGVVQVCLYAGFLAKGREATLADAVDHIEHIIAVGGIDCVGIGSDFDGGGGIIGCRGANELIRLTVELLRRGHSEGEIAKIWGGNLRRVINEIQEQAEI